VRRQKSKALALRIAGSPPISATGYAMERLRCDTCGEVFTAPTPPQAGTRKYAPSVGVTVALLRYGSGMPHYRLARLQKSLGVPLPESTQWEVMKPLFEQAQPIFEQVIAQAANSPLIHQDDTTMRILAHCLSHGRREFVTVAPSFPNECRHVREALGEVYRVDAQAKEQEMNPEQRLVHHQSHSQPVMEQLQAWMRQQMEDKKVEPNSGLGQAMAYMLKHWEPLTLFLRKAGAPLDNNRCEQALKMAILHRKNSLSYKTLTGARTGDLFMSLIHTCRLNGVNPFEYLLAIATHPDAVKLVPQAWLPWNYPKSGMTPDSS
jgi:transposase